MRGQADTLNQVFPVLGQTVNWSSLWMWLGVLIVVTVVGGFVALAMRRNLLGPSRAAGLESNMFKDLRDMRDRGEISPEEFERTHGVIVARLSGKEVTPRAAMPGPGEAIATPGFDLTGEALPKRTPNNEGSGASGGGEGGSE